MFWRVNNNVKSHPECDLIILYFELLCFSFPFSQTRQGDFSSLAALSWLKRHQFGHWPYSGIKLTTWYNIITTERCRPCWKKQHRPALKPAPKHNICWSWWWPFTSKTSICCVLVLVYAVFFQQGKYHKDPEMFYLFLWYFCISKAILCLVCLIFKLVC